MDDLYRLLRHHRQHPQALLLLGAAGFAAAVSAHRHLHRGAETPLPEADSVCRA